MALFEFVLRTARDTASVNIFPAAAITKGLDGQEMSDALLREKIREAHAKDSEVRAVLGADGKVAHARVVHVVDLLRLEHVNRFALEVKPGT